MTASAQANLEILFDPVEEKLAIVVYASVGLDVHYLSDDDRTHHLEPAKYVASGIVKFIVHQANSGVAEGSIQTLPASSGASASASAVRTFANTEASTWPEDSSNFTEDSEQPGWFKCSMGSTQEGQNSMGTSAAAA